MEWLETIEILDNVPQRLSYHEERYRLTYYHHFGRYPAEPLSAIIDKNMENYPSLAQRTKCRITYSEKQTTAEFLPYRPKNLSSLQIVEDNFINYGYKNKHRSNLARLLNKKKNCDEVLILKNGVFTDISYGNCVFVKNETYITPRTPLLKGTRRACYIDNESIIEGDIGTEDLCEYEYLTIINAMLALDEIKIDVSHIYL